MPNYDLGTAHGRIIVDSSTIGRTTSALDKLGKSMLAVGAIGAIAFGYAIKSAADFEAQLSRFKAVTDAPQKDMEALRKKALQLGQDSAYGATEVIKAFVELGKSGANVTEILAGLGDATVELAAAGEIPLADASVVLVNALKQFQLPASQAVHVANLLAGAANASTSEVDDLANSLRYAGPVAAFAGISIEDTATALAIFANAGIKGSAAGTAMRAFLLGIAGTTPKASKELKKLGIITEDGTNQFYDMNGKLKPLPEVFQILGDSMKNMNPHEKTLALNAIFLRRGLVSAALAATSGADGFGKMRKEVEKTTAHDVMKEKLNNLEGSLKILKASLETFAITMGELFLPALKKAADFFRRLTNELIKLSPEQKKILGYVLAGVTAFFLIGGALSFAISRTIKAYRAFRDLAAALKLIAPAAAEADAGFALTGFGAVVLAIVAIGAALYLLWTNWDKIWGWIKDHPAIAAVIAAFLPMVAALLALIGILHWVWNHWDEIWGWIKQAATDAADWITQAWDDIEGAFNDAVDWVGQAVDDIIQFFEDLPGDVVDALEQFGQDVLTFFERLPGRILDALGDAATWLLDVGHDIMYGLGYGLVLGVASIVAFFVGIPALIAALFVEAVQWLVGPGVQILIGLLNGLVSFLGNVLDFFIQLPGRILQLLGSAINWLTTTGVDILVGLLNGLLSFIGNVLNFFIQLPGRILNILSNAGSWLVNTGIAVIAGFASGLPGRFASVLSWFGGLGSSILGALGDMGGVLVHAGERLIGGLLEGIKDAFEEVKDFVGGIADTIAGLKGPPSYDKVLLIKNGKLIMDSLAKGLMSGWPQIVDLLSDMSATIGSPISGAVAYNAASSGIGRATTTASGGGAAGPSRVVNQTVTIEALNAREAAIRVERERAWAERTAGVS